MLQTFHASVVQSIQDLVMYAVKKKYLACGLNSFVSKCFNLMRDAFEQNFDKNMTALQFSAGQ